MKILDRLSLFFLICGGLNWGLVGVADFNVIMWSFIAMSRVQHLIYILFGLSAIWMIARVCQRGKPL